jgi:hypothetical protein
MVSVISQTKGPHTYDLMKKLLPEIGKEFNHKFMFSNVFPYNSSDVD